MVRGRQAQRLGQLPRPAPRGRAATRSRSSGRATTRRRRGRSPTASCTREVCRFANVLKKHGVKKGDRVSIYMPMIPEAAIADARLRPHRRDPLRRLRRLLADSLAGPHRRLRVEAGHHRRRGLARRQAGAAQGERRRGAARKSPGARSKVLVVRRTGGEVAMKAGPRPLVARAGRRRLRRLPAGGDGRRGPALHPLHLRLDRQAEGRAAHDRRLPGLRGAHAPATSSTTTTATSTGAPPTSAG